MLVELVLCYAHADQHRRPEEEAQSLGCSAVDTRIYGGTNLIIEKQM